MNLQAGGKYLLRKGNEMKVYGLGWEPGHGTVAHCAVSFAQGDTFEIYELHGRLHYSIDDSESGWDVVEAISEPECENSQPETFTAIPGAFSVDGRPVYLYCTEDIHRNRLLQAVRITSDPDYQNGYRRLDAVKSDEQSEFQWAIKNPPA